MARIGPPACVLSIGAIVLLTLPFPGVVTVIVFQRFNATRYWRTLEAAETIAGMHVPAGSRVRYADKKQSIPVSIESPNAIEIRGM